MNSLKRFLAPLRKKIYLIIGRAILKAIDNSETTQKLQIVALNGETITGIERFQNYGFESYPLVDAEALGLFLNGNRDNGIVICVHDRRHRPTDLASGEVAVYHSEGHRVLLKAGGVIEIEGTEIKIGDVAGTLNKLLNKLAMDIYNGHTHNDPVAGVTGVPNTLMVENTDTTEKTTAN